jgi:alkylhydroperoxidase family enzyme
VSRIEPLRPPYPPGVAEQLAAMMPPGHPPLLLFRTFVVNPAMAEAMRSWGSYELGRSLSLSMREREIVIQRTCARCRCEYEWGVHVAAFAERVGLTRAQIRSLAVGDAADPGWDDADRVLIEAVDALHDQAAIDDDLWLRMEPIFSEQQRLDLLLLCGWYHAISFAANGARVELEPGAPRFTDVA